MERAEYQEQESAQFRLAEWNAQINRKLQSRTEEETMEALLVLLRAPIRKGEKIGA